MVADSFDPLDSLAQLHNHGTWVVGAIGLRACRRPRILAVRAFDPSGPERALTILRGIDYPGHGVIVNPADIRHNQCRRDRGDLIVAQYLDYKVRCFFRLLRWLRQLALLWQI
jgi:hypothetical protein